LPTCCVAPAIAAMMEQGIAIIKQTLERTERDQAGRRSA
jgi:hypothetical protein